MKYYVFVLCALCKRHMKNIIRNLLPNHLSKNCEKKCKEKKSWFFCMFLKKSIKPIKIQTEQKEK